MFSLLNEKILAIEESVFVGLWAARNNLYAPKGEIEKPEILMKSIENDLNAGELGWYLDISTEKAKNGLVAIVQVKGAIGSNWDYGVTPISFLKQQIQYAAGNSNVVAIVLAISSPGGVVNGMMALAQEVLNAKSRVPVVAHIQFIGCSAAYPLAASCSEIWIESGKTTQVGSLGVYNILISHFDAMQKAGEKAMILRYPEDKALLHPLEPLDENDPKIKDAIDKEMALVKNLRGEMLDFVRANRPQISAEIGGGVFYGRDAIKNGLADKVGSLDDAIVRAAYLGLKK